MRASEVKLLASVVPAVAPASVVVQAAAGSKRTLRTLTSSDRAIPVITTFAAFGDASTVRGENDVKEPEH